MKTTITAKNMTVSPAITARIMKKTATMERYLKPDTQMFGAHAQGAQPAHR